MMQPAGRSTFAALFPAGAGPGRVLLPNATRRAVQAIADRRGIVAHGCEQGLLRTPDWTRERLWLSGTVTAAAGPGTLAKGWIETEFASPAAAGEAPRAADAAAAVVAHRLGAASFELSRIAVRPVVIGPAARDEPETAAARLATCLAMHQAASVLLLMPVGATGLRWRSVADAARRQGVAVATEPGDPWQLLDSATDIHGGAAERWPLLGRLAARTVHDGGRPNDTAAWARAALVAGVRYADPFTQRALNLADALDIAIDWHRHGRANRRIAAAIGMSVWKRRRMAQFLSTGRTAPSFSLAAARRSPKGAAVAAWATRIPAGLEQELGSSGRSLVRVEDGFVRSRGLGSNFLPPCSIVLDWSGHCLDPSRPSDLERILAETAFDTALLDRARRLIGRLVGEGVTKYGRASAAGRVRLPPPSGRRVILVPGQVADDLSVRLAGCGVDNAALLAAARRAEPDAFIIYKPHPDVVAGHRPGQIDAAAAAMADQVVDSGSMHDLIAIADAVHTITSLAGFEAILRGRPVVTHGQPFYAGWGLTSDRNPVARRQRRLSAEALVAGALLLYPRYLDPVTGLLCPVEILLDRMAEPELWQPGLLVRLRSAQGRMKAALGRWLHPSRQPGGVT